MPPQLALLLTVVLIVVLFRKDSLRQYQSTYALWIPCIWLLILGSRPASMWMSLGNPYDVSDVSPEYMLEGSPVDRAVFLSLMAAGLLALWRRQIAWSQVLRNNVWLILYFLYCGISVSWSDFPFVAGKRWIKALGDPMMVLIVLTEPEPLKAIETVIKRCTFILISFSILFIKYYPHLGKAYDQWTGANFYVGVTTNKNTLGLLCFTFGLFYFGRFCYLRMRQLESSRKSDLLLILVLFCMFSWCFYTVDSNTALVSLFLGISIYIALGYQNVRNNFGSYTVAALLLCAILQLGFNVSDKIAVAVGRDSTVTGRTELWEVVLNMQKEPLLGYGFESFWLGDRLKKIWDMYYFQPNMAHNGYIEIFLNLGLVGLGLFVGVLVSSYHKISKELKSSAAIGQMERIDFDKLRMAFLLSFSIFNVTD